MDTKPLTIPVPPWAHAELEQVHSYVRESLPESLQAFWESDGFGLAGFDRQPLRPYLVLLIARHYGCAGDRPLRLAASIHMIHMASLLHDRLGYARKVLDETEDADQEHHQREALDILLGDFFFSKASGFIVEDGEKRIIREHIQTSLETAEAQARLVSLEKELDRAEPAKCFEVVADKVSLLLALSLRVGAILGKGQSEEEESLAGCGFLLGRMLRILEDLSIWERFSRKNSLLPPDARFGYPLILLWEKEGREVWEEAARRLNASGEPERTGLGAMLDEQGYLAAARSTAFTFAEQALGRLSGLAETEELRFLEAVVRFRLGPEQPPEQEVSP
jgi:geranylgeranyl pyrophosphate synthase